MVEIFLAKALICFASVCHPALIGDRTPVGEFPMQVVRVAPPQYGGHVVKFADDPRDKKYMFAIHRSPTAHRASLLKQASRPPVTLGCVNVSPETYDALALHVRSGNTTLVIHE